MTSSQAPKPYVTMYLAGIKCEYYFHLADNPPKGQEWFYDMVDKVLWDSFTRSVYA